MPHNSEIKSHIELDLGSRRLSTSWKPPSQIVILARVPTYCVKLLIYSLSAAANTTLSK